MSGIERPEDREGIDAALIALRINHDANLASNYQSYLTNLHGKYLRRPAFQTYLRDIIVQATVELLDPQAGLERGRPASQAFQAGGLFALRVLEISGLLIDLEAGDLQGSLPAVDLSGADGATAKHNLMRQAILSVGRSGLERYRAYENFASEWAVKAAYGKDMEFVCGFGYVLERAHEDNLRRDLAAMRNEVEGMTDDDMEKLTRRLTDEED